MQKGTCFWLAVAMCIGIALAAFSFHIGLLLLTVIFILFIYSRFRSLLLWILIFTCFSALYFSHTDKNNKTVYHDKVTDFYGHIVSLVDIDGDKISFEVITMEKEKLIVNYFLKNERDKVNAESVLYPGAFCHFQGEFNPPPLPTNPHMFDYKKHLYERKINWITTLNNAPINCIKDYKTNIFMDLQKHRQEGIRLILDNTHPTVQSFLIALVFGERRYIDEEVINAYQKLGLIHLLAISGLHVGVLCTTLFFLGIRVGLTKESMYKVLLMFLPIYIHLAGGAPSVWRASIMSFIVILLLIQNKKIAGIDVIGMACIILLFLNPYYLFHVGFQLSFAVSAFLILSHKIIQRTNSYVLQLFFVSIIAQLASFPIIIYHFYEISIWSIFLNVVYVPFFSLFVLPCALMLYISLKFFPVLYPILETVLQYPLAFFNYIAIQFAEIPIGHFLFGKPSILIMLFYYITFIFFCIAVELQRKKLIHFSIVFILLLLFYHWNSPLFNKYGQVTMIDIGQGDAIFIQLPFGKGNYLIDTGGIPSIPREEWRKRRKEFNNGEGVLVQVLKGNGIRKLDKLILTHGHYDHVGNVEMLLKNIDVKNILVPPEFGQDEFEKNILELVRNKGIEVNFVREGDRWRNANFEFLILYPSKKHEDKNDQSIVLLTRLGGLTWLFTGDLEQQGEMDLLSLYPNITADVLKVGHHGSNTSTTEAFLAKLNPSFALIPVGTNNRFGHPHPEVIRRLESRGVQIYRTDENGAIVYRFSNKYGTFSPTLP
ncbi:DNA internalization-related competence protein ComEC/Rec2 [Bacillus sp. FJAT-45066]|uniref:DNA internalization-related competence protein ComEC/Rec2 n=1 Tax=Bacillus sp. FJAT-45066 TaxID=2011010 RepID=UPI000BB76BF9|nr:DNA internalization-related competence protein ComEC/Rec2 [Bacillus sp. FJAT-45066]